MYVRLENITEAEMAIIVEDGWQSNGVGKSLLSELDERARRRGIDTFVGDSVRTGQCLHSPPRSRGRATRWRTARVRFAYRF